MEKLRENGVSIRQLSRLTGIRAGVIRKLSQHTEPSPVLHSAVMSNSFSEGDPMVFRKESLMFYQSELFYSLATLLCLALAPILGWYTLFYISPFLILIFVNPKLHNEFITINEAGISCQRSGKQLWAYDWDHIAELRRSSRFLMPSIEVIVYDKHGQPEQFAGPDKYFQLGRTAKEAMKRYRRCTD